MTTAMMKKCMILTSVLFGIFSSIQTSHSFVVERSACCSNLSHRRHKVNRNFLNANNNPEDNTESGKKKEITDNNDEDRVEVFLAMEEASKRTTRRLLLPRMIVSSIGQTIQYSAYAFLIFSFALNIAGYSFINDGNGIRIGTMEEKAFLMEIAKSMKDK